MNQTETLKEFYPTPPKLILKMLQGITPSDKLYVLEPSAGKGDIVKFWITAVDYLDESWRYRYIPDNICNLKDNQQYILEHDVAAHYNDEDHRLNKAFSEKVDCIESEPVLRDVLKGQGLRVVGNDFLSYNGDKKYDLIIMNPPFSNGEDHLLKAIQIGKPYGSKIVCILNAQTLKNPCTNKRKMLVQQLEKLHADIEYVQEAFSDAERKTNVEIAIVRIQCPKPEFDGSHIFENLKRKVVMWDQPEDCTDLVTGKEYEQAVLMYKTEIEVGKKIISDYLSLSPYILSSFDEGKHDNPAYQTPEPVLQLVVAGKTNKDIDFNDFVYAVRYKYWSELLNSASFLKNLTSDLKQTYRQRIDEFANYDFSLSNIYEIQIQVLKDTISGIEKKILDLFESFTHEYSMECEGNIHYFNGWKTNKAFIINKKVIQPYCAWDSIFNKFRYTWDLQQVFADMEKVFDNLMGEASDTSQLFAQLQSYEDLQQTKNLHFKYFDVTFYKKGTAHITFTNEEALKRLNIFGCQKKGWLPPSYGKKKYQDMDEEEQKVIDEFEGEQTYDEMFVSGNNPVLDTQRLLLGEGNLL